MLLIILAMALHRDSQSRAPKFIDAPFYAGPPAPDMLEKNT